MKNSVARCGLDIGKRHFVVFGVDQSGKCQLRKKLKRSDVLAYFSQLPACVVGIESCGGSHYWARELCRLGHEARLIAAKYVTPYRQKNKNDMNDAEAICEAVARPNIHFVAIKSEAQQSVLMMHRMRSQSISVRTSLINQIHGHLQEFGVVVSQGRHKLLREMHDVLARDDLPALLIELLHDLIAALQREQARIACFDRKIAQWTQNDPMASKLMTLDGVGALTASAVVATAGDHRAFKNGRQFAAWLGLVPQQRSTGGVSRLGPITKRGDRYLRTLLIHGARTVLLMARKQRGSHQAWISQLRERKPDNVVAVAFAAKQARMAWALMAGKQSGCSGMA